MTYTIKSEKIGNYTISIYQAKYSKRFIVEVLRSYSDGSGLAHLEKEHDFASIRSANNKYNKYIKYYKA